MKSKRLLVQLMILAFLLLLLTLTGWGGYVLSSYGYISGLIIISFSIIMGGWVLLSALHRLTKYSWMVVLLFFLLCGWGIVVYEPTTALSTNPVEKILAPLNTTLSIFFPTRGGFEETKISDITAYHLLHLCAYFFVALFMFSIFGRRLINSSRRFLVLRSNKNIFWGDSHGGRLLAQNILNTKLWQEAVFIFSNELKDDVEQEKILFEKIDAIGGIVLYRDFDHIHPVPKGHRHFLLTEDQDFNLNMALRIAKTCKYKTAIYLRTDMPRVDFLFHELLKENELIELHLLNQSSLVANQLVSDYPLIDLVPCEQIKNLTVDFHFNILFIGFGSQARELLHKTICDAQFKGSTFAATIIARNADMKNGDYRLLFDECIKAYNLTFIDDTEICNTGSHGFYRWFDENHGRYNRIIVSLGDDNQNLNCSLALANLMIARGEMSTEKKLFVHIAHAAKYAYSEYPVTMFGRLDRLYTYDVVVAEQTDRVAKAVNYVYSHNETNGIDWLEAEKSWVNMKHTNSTFNKDSSRAVASNVKNIIRIAGGRRSFDAMMQQPAMLEILAENEHLRWNAFHLTQGIKRWDEITEDNPNGAKLFKYPEVKAWLLKHACLVPFAEMDKISARVNEINAKSGLPETDYREIDRMIIRHFGLFYDILCP